MAYKDKDKQREAGKKRVRRYRDKQKGVTSEGVTQGVTSDGSVGIETLAKIDVACGDKLSHGLTMTPEGPMLKVPANYGQADCRCRHCQQTKILRERGQLTLNHGARKTITELGDNEINRVSLPDDVDYQGVAVATTIAQDRR